MRFSPCWRQNATTDPAAGARASAQRTAAAALPPAFTEQIVLRWPDSTEPLDTSRKPLAVTLPTLRWPRNGGFRREMNYAACAGACSASYWLPTTFDLLR
jgi:hypothetical protein